jgi:hypothetical protein
VDQHAWLNLEFRAQGLHLDDADEVRVSLDKEKEREFDTADLR